jgi:alpha-mannosidase
MENEKKVSSNLFWWESEDGSRVLAFRIPYAYLDWWHDKETDIVKAKAAGALLFCLAP